MTQHSIEERMCRDLATLFRQNFGQNYIKSSKDIKTNFIYLIASISAQNGQRKCYFSETLTLIAVEEIKHYTLGRMSLTTKFKLNSFWFEQKPRNKCDSYEVVKVTTNYTSKQKGHYKLN
jgi:hypothetical protein